LVDFSFFRNLASERRLEEAIIEHAKIIAKTNSDKAEREQQSSNAE